MVRRGTLDRELHRRLFRDGTDLEFLQNLVVLFVLGRTHIDDLPLKRSRDGCDCCEGDVQLYRV